MKSTTTTASETIMTTTTITMTIAASVDDVTDAHYANAVALPVDIGPSDLSP